VKPMGTYIPFSSPTKTKGGDKMKLYKFKLTHNYQDDTGSYRKGDLICLAGFYRTRNGYKYRDEDKKFKYVYTDDNRITIEA